MSDPYIDKFETILYGRFTASQIKSLVLGLDPELDGAISVIAARLTVATDAMEQALSKAGELDLVTYAAASKSTADPVADGRRVLRQVASYVGSRDNAEAVTADLLNRENIGTVTKRRPVKLAGALGVALSALEKHKASLPEHADWAAKLSAAKAALDGLNESVRKTRSTSRAMTPETTAARDKWLLAYASTKDVVSAVLRGTGKLSLLPEVFDDLAEVHRVPGVTDEGPSAPASPA